MMIILIIGQCLVLTIIVLTIDDIGYRIAFDRVQRHCATWWAAVVRPKLIESQLREAHIGELEKQLIALGAVPVAVDDVLLPASGEVDRLQPDFGTKPIFDHGQTADLPLPDEETSDGRSYSF